MSDFSEKDLRQATDEELCALSKKGNDDAFSALVGRYIFTVHDRASGYYGSGIDSDDLTQEGMIGLMSAVRCYDKDCGASFRTFAWLCIDRSIISAVRSTLRKKQIPSSSIVSIDDWDEPDLNNGSDPEAVLIAKEDMNLLNEKIFNRLTDFELSVLKMYLGGYSYSSIASSLACPVKAVDNALQRLRRKLK
ncbi:MAG: sigma-70 family RNA polymerase sigma factor [Clostridia bacterium]|nr:sigma-70 family RNA polymerase sigma factor [Clostridia bacterium]